MPPLDRRDFLRLSGAGALVVLGGCGSESGSGPDLETEPPIEREPEMLDPGDFAHGVASGDPAADGVILWTRVTPRAPDAANASDASRVSAAVRIVVEVAEDEDFAALLHRAVAVAEPARDWTVKVALEGQAPGVRLYYRFRSADAVSTVGRTRTLPTGPVASASFAVVSCSNYPAGHFNVYREILRHEDLDAVIHLGDYLYEYGTGGYGTENSDAIGRSLPPGDDRETVTLADYRRRYATYRGDPDLQALHAAHAFVLLIDDHEIANNVWRGGAENHDPDEGDFLARRDAALQAWFEWLPVRPPEVAAGAAPASPPRIGATGLYRRYDWGDRVTLHRVDARVLNRDEAVDRNAFIDRASVTIDAAAYAAALAAPDRTMLGSAQFDALSDAIMASPARWQVIAQQVPMARLHVPAEMRVDIERRSDPALLDELVAIRRRLMANDPTLDAASRARVQDRIPFYTDGWDGYPAERERLLRLVASLDDRRLLVLAGDTHNAWASDLATDDGTVVGCELAATAVSSPGLARFYGARTRAEAARVEAALVELIDDVRHVNVLERGYLHVTCADEMVASFHHVDRVDSRDYRPVDEAGVQARTVAGSRGVSVVRAGGLAAPGAG